MCLVRETWAQCPSCLATWQLEELTRKVSTCPQGRPFGVQWARLCAQADVDHRSVPELCQRCRLAIDLASMSLSESKWSSAQHCRVVTLTPP
ncbi:hypothetical protein DOTSEDRAFT_70703 [Dothistroma septosporum NZE10]|uniref:Uncharacterized protein n=1 Tax=Dothistroma septosporum (strain NZE10 / CBS 128990) TaxID=675120 RepID=N1PX69_DOTSN|nr:hypothetical protein DOTSEDRAFT_70703 [Dothistroma septosporum NZE10]